MATGTAVPPEDTIQAKIQGDISGQVAIGHHILQIGSVHGGLITVLPPEQQAPPKLRPVPARIRPRAFPGLLDRGTEIASATSCLQSATPLEFHGDTGVGKTSLLRHLAYQPAVSLFPGGIVCLSAHNQPIDDLLLSLFDSFYDSSTGFKPTNGYLRQALNGIQALILLDDVDLTRDDVERVMDALPGCTFLLTTLERRLWGEGTSIALSGLPENDAVALIERELGRNLTDEERLQAQQLCTSVEGHPLRIMQAAALARDRELTFAELAQQLSTAEPDDVLAANLVDSLSEDERRVLGVLAAFSGTPVNAEHLESISQIAGATNVLESLTRRRLALAASSGISIAATTMKALRTWDLTAIRSQALEHFAAWSERTGTTVDMVMQQSNPILLLLGWAAETNRWADVLRLGRAVEESLAQSRHWGAWRQVLTQLLRAAEAVGERGIQAWALHQLGTRALCLDQSEEAYSSLSRALDLRLELGDELGAQVTRHNLNLLVGPAPPAVSNGKPPAPPRSPLISGVAAVAIAAAVVAAIAVGTILWYLLGAVAAPSGLTASAIADNQIALSWTDNSSNEDGFIVERHDGNGSFSEIAQVGKNATAFTDSGLEAGNTYTYRVRAINKWAPGTGSRRSDPSNEANATVGQLVSLDSLTLDPTQVTAGSTSTGSITLDNPAPPDGVSIQLASDDANVASVPDRVTVASGETTATFEIATHPVNTPTSAEIVATLRDITLTASLDVEPGAPVVALVGVTLNPSEVTGGDDVTGTVSLSAPAPDGGVRVALSSSDPGTASLTSDSVNIPAGQTSASFDVRTTQVQNPVDIVITAGLDGTQETADLTVGPPGLPDLSVSRLQTTGEPQIAPDGSVRVPISVVITNTGGSAADAFKVSVQFAGPNNTSYVAPFVVSGQDDLWYPHTSAPLDPGADITFNGYAVLNASYQGRSVSAWAVADSCSGDEFMPNYCRVQEIDEENNRSDQLEFNLPLAAPSKLTTRNTGQGVLLRWAGSSENADGYEIWRSIDGVESAPIDTVPATDSSYIDTDLHFDELSEGPHVFKYRIRAISEAGVSSAFSNESSVTIAIIK